MSFYDRIAEYYDLSLGQAGRHREEALRMHSVFQEHGVETVLDLACGTGSHMLELAALGYRCVGQDLSPSMLKVAERKARARGLTVELAKGDMRAFASTLRFDAVLALYVLTSLESDADWAAVLASTYDALRPGGMFFFNVLNADGRQPGRSEAGVPPRLFMGPTVEDGEVRIVRLHNLAVEDDIWTLTGIYLIQDRDRTRLEINDDHLRFRALDEVEGMLSSNGFRMGPVVYRDAMGRRGSDMHICAFRA